MSTLDNADVKSLQQSLHDARSRLEFAVDLLDCGPEEFERRFLDAEKERAAREKP